MRYIKFRICNFKGIKDTEVDLRSSTGANVFAFVGLNESGKTTILEAIHSFSPDHRTRSLRKTKNISVSDAAKNRLPRHLLARFTGEIVVEAFLAADAADRRQIADTIKGATDITVDPDNIPEVFSLSRADKFDRGDYLVTNTNLSFIPKGRKKGSKIEREITGDEYAKVYEAIWSLTPDIAYHDSFIFDFPARIYLTDRPGVNDWTYRKMFEDVLAAGRVPYELDDITRRIKNDKYSASWLDFFTKWSENDEKVQIQ